MDAPTHVAIALWASQHAELKGFLRLSDPEIAFYATEPDKIFHDNVISGEADERWYHSHKLDSNGVYVAGGVHTMLGAFGIEAHNYREAGDFPSVRRLIGLASHYAVDSCTIWHTMMGAAATHMSGEEALNVHIDAVLAGLDRTPATLTHKSIGQSTADAAHETWSLFAAQIAQLKDGAELKQMPDLAKAMLSRCAQFSLAVQLQILRRALGG